MKEKPVFLLAGGRNASSAAIIKAVFQEIAAPRPNIAYVGAANNDDERFFKRVADEITRAGNCAVMHALLAAPGADIAKAKEVLQQADAIFVSGGDVEAGMQVLESHRLVPYFQHLYEQGKLFFGASAGSIMLAREWVRWQDPEDDTTAELFPCLNIAPVLIDTHAEADDWEELQVAMKLSWPGSTGYGIPSGGCLKVYPDEDVQPLGLPIVRFAKTGVTVVKLEDLPV